MGILKDIIMQTLNEQGIQAEWVGNAPKRIKSAAQSKYDDVRAVERNYTRGVNKARNDTDKRRTILE